MSRRLHHVGIVVAHAESAAAEFVNGFGYQVRSKVIHDPVQTVYGLFLQRPDDPVYLELVAPDSAESTVSGALKRGGGLHHLCYAVPDIDEACQTLPAEGMILIQEPVPAVAFSDRRIAWLMGRNRVLVELLEEGIDAWS